jgi:hypothetical protein
MQITLQCQDAVKFHFKFSLFTAAAERRGIKPYRLRLIKKIHRQFVSLTGILDERSRRQWTATEVERYGRGGLRRVCEATGMSHNTTARGMKELWERRQLPAEEQSAPLRIRQTGGGKKLAEEKDRALLPLLRRRVEPTSRGDPMKPLCWTIMSTYTIAEELTKQGHPVSHRMTVGLLKADDYRLQNNRKTKEGNQHPDRNEQFEYINRQSLKLRAGGVGRHEEEGIGREFCE